MTSRTLLLCALVALMAVCCSAGSSYSSSSSSSSSSSGGNIYFGDPAQAYSGSSSFASGSPGHGGFDGPGLVVRSGVFDGGDSGTKGVFSSSSSKIDSDGKIHYSVQAGRI